MKRNSLLFLRVVVFLTYFLVWMPASLAEEAEPTFQDVYWGIGDFSLRLQDVNGNRLYEDPFTVEQMAEGVVLHYTSSMAYKEDLSVFVLYEGEVLPFYPEHAKEAVWQYDWTLPAEKEAGSVLIQLEPETMREKVKPGTNIQFFLVTWQNVWDIEETRSLYNVMSPVVVWMDEEIPSTTMFPPINSDVVRMWIREADGVAVERPAVNEGDEGERHFVFGVDSTQPEIAFRLTECREDYVVIPMLNRRLIIQEDGHVLSARAVCTGDEVAEGSITLPLEPGANELLFILQPASGAGLAGSSYKYVMTVP